MNWLPTPSATILRWKTKTKILKKKSIEFDISGKSCKLTYNTNILKVIKLNNWKKQWEET